MDGFYISLIFLGILLVLFSLILVFFDKRKSFGFMKSYEKKKQELIEIINDAELMIEELNKFSDYIVNQMDLKNEELSRNLSDAEKRIDKINDKLKPGGLESSTQPVQEEIITEAVAANSGIINTVEASTAYLKHSGTTHHGNVKKADKIIPIKNKYSEVIRLSGEGIKNADIAQRLNIGKGEVELILGLRK